ncbi:MAG: hypothetical protein KatS3mg051_2009 [Anaerolineae bacterium]|nr:MAG: hypothetical protein KatS3mg051_2009 [Anaerolineae bacterium]
MLSLANEPRFADVPPARIVPLLADEGRYVASESTFHRVLREHGQTARRGRAKAPTTVRPPTTHVATAPRQVWCWDMTYLPTTVRKRLAASRPRPLPASGPNQVWAYDFVFDACANGQPLKCLVITDEWTHEALQIDVQGSIRSRRVIDVLSKLVSEHGAPRYLRSDNGPEFVSHAILRWLQETGIETAYIEPGKPWQNGTAESLNGKFRDECLSMEWFRNRTEARVIIETWRQHYNEDRPHSSLGYRTPKQFKDEDKQREQASTHQASLN